MRGAFGPKRPAKPEVPGAFNEGVFLHLKAGIRGRKGGFAGVFGFRNASFQDRGPEKNILELTTNVHEDKKSNKRE
jgi:hypothetical protein